LLVIFHGITGAISFIGTVGNLSTNPDFTAALTSPAHVFVKGNTFSMTV
jgi:hypothetical protein